MIYDYKVTRANGEELDLATLKGKVIIYVFPISLYNILFLIRCLI